LVDDCRVLGAVGHVWRRQGTYRRRDPEPMQRWQCGACGQTTTRRPGRPAPPHLKPGPLRGHTVQGVGGIDAFWDSLAANVVRAGLHESVRMAARTVGVHPVTAHRWVKARNRFDSAKGVEWELLSGALEAVRAPRSLPKAFGLDDWRKIRGWKYPQFSEGDFGEPEESRLIRREGTVLWQVLLDAAAIASVVVGEGSPLDFASCAPDISTDSTDALREGGLMGRPSKVRHYVYWLSFEHTQWDAWAIARVYTRTRLIGLSRVRFRWLPEMTLRVDLPRAWSSYDSVTIPVPSATLTHHRTPLTFPLELKLG